MKTTARIAAFRQQLAAGVTLAGTFQKTPNAAVTEILALAGLDCVCVDTEHAPFDRAALDNVILAARSHDFPSLVRVPENNAAKVLQALDLGATGIIVPHVTNGEEARSIVRAARFGAQGRGYSGATRAAGYATRRMTEIISEANARVCVVAQIEDESALGQIDDIAAVEGIDCLFIGRMDLAVSLGATGADDPRVVEAVRHICAAGRRQGRCIGMFTASHAEALHWRKEGASLFLLDSDQQWILEGGRKLAQTFKRNET